MKKINNFTIENYDETLKKEDLINKVLEILNHPNGWSKYYNKYEYNDKEYDIKIIFKEKPLPWNNLSFQIFNRLYINTNNWKNNGEDYKYYIINHELGHYYRKGHFDTCIDGKAPIMMQQTLGIKDCQKNVFPLQEDYENNMLFKFEEWFFIITVIVIIIAFYIIKK